MTLKCRELFARAESKWMGANGNLEDPHSQAVNKQTRGFYDELSYESADRCRDQLISEPEE
jgi:hypothetical protein